MGLMMVWFQFLCVLPATLALLFLPSESPLLSWVPAGPPALIYVFLIAIAVSRLPLWAFDLGERQIMQTSIAEHERGTVNSVEGSLTNAFMFVASLCGIVISDPENFALVGVISQVAVGAAALTFTAYAVRNWDKELLESGSVEVEMWEADDTEMTPAAGAALFTITDEDDDDVE
jgi:hypothetical protein